MNYPDYFKEVLSFFREDKTNQQYTHHFSAWDPLVRRDRKRTLIRGNYIQQFSGDNYRLTHKGQEVLRSLGGAVHLNSITSPEEKRKFSNPNGSVNEEKVKKAVIEYLRKNGPSPAKVIAKNIGATAYYVQKKAPIWATEGILFHRGTKSASRFWVKENPGPALHSKYIPELEQEVNLLQREISGEDLEKIRGQVPVSEPFWWLEFASNFLLMKERKIIGIASGPDWTAYEPIDTAGKSKGLSESMRILALLNKA